MVGSSEKHFLGRDIDSGLNWAKTPGLPLKAGKSELLSKNAGSITIAHGYDLAIDAVSKVNNPGIQAASNFKWGDQRGAAAKKAMEEHFRLRSAQSVEIFVLMYKAFVAPQLE